MKTQTSAICCAAPRTSPVYPPKRRWASQPNIAVAPKDKTKAKRAGCQSKKANKTRTAKATAAPVSSVLAAEPATHPGFELVKVEMVDEYTIKCATYRHIKSGAELISAQADDDNKVFGIVFRTPVSDSTGVPHILEHSVLCGSDKYTSKEPFVELLKGSLQTFLNAFTYRADYRCVELFKLCSEIRHSSPVQMSTVWPVQER